MLKNYAVNSTLLQLALTLILILLSGFPVSADSEISPVSSEKYEILKRIRDKHEHTHAIRATVYQDRELAALKQPLHIKGTIILQMPGLLRWETSVPEKSVMVINSRTITQYYPDAKEAEIHKLSDNFIARNTISFFTSVMWGALGEMDNKFNIEISGEDDEIIVELVPLSKIVSRYLSSVVIFYSEQTGMPRGFEVTTPQGDKTVTRLADIEMDPEIGDETFKLKMPADVYVRDYTETMDFN